MTREEATALAALIAKDSAALKGAAFTCEIAAGTMRKLKGRPVTDDDLERLAVAFEESARSLRVIR